MSYRPQDLPNAHARKWYAKGKKAGGSKKYGDDDAVTAYYALGGNRFKSGSSGKAVEAKEYFLGGFYDGRDSRANPKRKGKKATSKRLQKIASKIGWPKFGRMKLGKWTKQGNGVSVRVRKTKAGLVVETKKK